MIYSLLEGESTNTGALGGYGNWIMLGVLGILIVVVVVMYVLGNKKRKKQEQDVIYISFSCFFCFWAQFLPRVRFRLRKLLQRAILPRAPQLPQTL